MGGAAAAGGFDIGVGDLEAGALEAVDIVDDGAHEAVGRFVVEVDLDPLRLEDQVARLGFFRIVKEIFETAAARRLFAKPEAPAGFSFFRENFKKFLCSPLGDGDGGEVFFFCEDLVEPVQRPSISSSDMPWPYIPRFDGLPGGGGAAYAVEAGIGHFLGQFLALMGEALEDFLDGHFACDFLFHSPS